MLGWAGYGRLLAPAAVGGGGGVGPRGGQVGGGGGRWRGQNGDG